MKLITKDTDYAIRALMYLGRNIDKFIPSSEISSSERIPKHFLRTILQKLIKAGILVSREGSSGGVMLNKKSEEVCIIDVINIFQGRVQVSDCMFRNKVCPERAKCVIKSKIAAIESRLIKEFESITIHALNN